MNWKDLIGQNFSRKLGIAAITIIALCYLAKNGVSDTTQTNTPLIALYITIVGVCGIFVQGFLDFFRPRRRKNKEIKNIDDTIDQPIDQAIDQSVEQK